MWSNACSYDLHNSQILVHSLCDDKATILPALWIISSHFMPWCSLIAWITRSGDSTARIWTIADGTCRSSVQNGPSNVLVLKHVKGRTNEKSKDVTTLDWNVSFGALFYSCKSFENSESWFPAFAILSNYLVGTGNCNLLFFIFFIQAFTETLVA